MNEWVNELAREPSYEQTQWQDGAKVEYEMELYNVKCLLNGGQWKERDGECSDQWIIQWARYTINWAQLYDVVQKTKNYINIYIVSR